MFVKYPTMMYEGGDVEKAWRLAHNEDDEAALMAEGFRAPFDFPKGETDAEAAARKKREDAEAAEAKKAADAAELEALRAEAKSLGLTFHHKTGADTIRAAIEKKKLEG